MKKHMHKRAFTLIEVLLSSLILSIIIVSLYSFFYSGKQVYQRISSENAGEFSIYHFSVIFRKDIDRMIKWQDNYFFKKDNHFFFFVKNEEGPGSIERIDYIKKEKYKGNQKLYKIERISRSFPYENEDVSQIKEKDLLLDNCQFFNTQLLATVLNQEDKLQDRNQLGLFTNWNNDFFPYAIQIKLKKENSKEHYILSQFPEYQFKYPEKALIKTDKNKFIKLGSYEVTI